MSSSLWNSYANQGLNGVPYKSPAGFSDHAFDYIFPDPQQFPSGQIVLPHGQTVEFDQFTDQGSLFLWFGLEMPPPVVSGVSTSAGLYKVAIQIYLNDEAMFTDGLNNVVGFGNQSVPLPVFPPRWLSPGTLVRLIATNYDAADYYNFAVVFRGIRRYQVAGA